MIKQKILISGISIPIVFFVMAFLDAIDQMAIVEIPMLFVGIIFGFGTVVVANYLKKSSPIALPEPSMSRVVLSYVVIILMMSIPVFLGRLLGGWHIWVAFWDTVMLGCGLIVGISAYSMLFPPQSEQDA